MGWQRGKRGKEEGQVGGREGRGFGAYGRKEIDLAEENEWQLIVRYKDGTGKNVEGTYPEVGKDPARQGIVRQELAVFLAKRRLIGDEGW